jgi:hypothetical protein
MSEEITMAHRTAKSIPTEKFSWIRLTQGRWKLVLDESWAVETAENKMGEKHWYQQIPTYCGGFIGLYSLNPIVFQFWSPKQRKTAKKIFEEFKATPGVRLDEAMDGWEVVLYFPVELLHIVAERAGGRKKRQLSEDHRAKLVEAGKVGREALQKWQKERSKGDQTDSI